MRDGNRLKEKIELRLDQRQVVSFVMVALVLAGAIFALGVLVGKNLAAMPGRVTPAANENLLDRLDQSAKAGSAEAGSASPRPEGEGRGMGSATRALLDGGPDGLTFQEELTRPEAGEKRKPGKPEEKKPLVKLPKPALVDAGVTLAATVRSTPAPTPPPVAPSVAAPAPAPASPSSFFTVQVKATQSQEDAAHFVAKLAGGGYHPFVAEVDIAGKGHWYRVRVGKFDTRPKAEKYLADFKRETHLEAFVTAAGH